MMSFVMVRAHLRIALAAAAVLLLPGWVISQILGRMYRNRTDFLTTMGLSMAGVPLIALTLSIARVRVSRALLAGICIFCGILVLLEYIAQGLIFCRNVPAGTQSRELLLDRGKWSWILMVFITTLILRFIQIRDLALPAWVDSLHHTHIVEVIRQQGQIPNVLMYDRPVPFYYYFGFHVLAATFGELADLQSAQAILVFGQILNATVTLSIYQLAVELTRRPGVGISAAILTGFVSQMPAYYASWGRYTLTAGMVLLPITMAATLKLWHNPSQHQLGLQSALLTSGLILTHYLAAAFYFCFLLALVIIEMIGGKKTQWRRQVSSLAAWGGLGLTIVAPWIIRVFPYVIPFVRVHATASTIGADPTSLLNRVQYLWYLVNRPRSWAILALAIPAAGVSLASGRATRVLVLWLAMLIFLSNEWPWHIQPFRVD